MNEEPPQKGGFLLFKLSWCVGAGIWYWQQQWQRRARQIGGRAAS